MTCSFSLEEVWCLWLPDRALCKGVLSTPLDAITAVKCGLLKGARPRSEGQVPGRRWDNIPTPGYVAMSGVRPRVEE